MKKDALLNLTLSRRLHDAIQAEAEKHKISMSAYVRAVMTHQVLSNDEQQRQYEEGIINIRGGDVVLNG